MNYPRLTSAFVLWEKCILALAKERFDACLRCQAENKRDLPGRQDCVVVWGECNHSFHHCCMSLWVKQNNRCPLCQQEWSIQRMGK
uniref:RING-type domain-containing protein n=1 Tax=Glossina pallidipes TaxID=7398 RepID=A0A1A9ZNK8_GLOPL